MRWTLLLPLLLLPAVGHAGTQPDWRSGWGLTAAPGDAEQRAENGIASVKLDGSGDVWQARVENHLAGPVQVTLSQDVGTALLPGLPMQTLLPPEASVVVQPLRLPATAQRLALRLEAIPGDPAARPQDVAYQLPFLYTRFQVTQAPQGRYSHTDAENRDAIDFALPEGTPVLAARRGKVMQVQGQFSENGTHPTRDRARANFIRILHEDGSMAVYAHLRANGVLVRRGQQVEAGQRIGLSGNTGYSTAPHLHFVVQANVGMQLQSVPVRIVTDRGELRFAREDAPASP
jgi:murein DD-endopeptidase MepM/ murein hydrolase activator NlpD